MLPLPPVEERRDAVVDPDLTSNGPTSWATVLHDDQHRRARAAAAGAGASARRAARGCGCAAGRPAPVLGSSTSSAATPRHVSTRASPVRSSGPELSMSGSSSGSNVDRDSRRALLRIRVRGLAEDRGVPRLPPQQLPVRSDRDDHAAVEEARRGPPARSSTVGARRRARCGPRGSGAARRSTSASVCTSSADSGSSRTSTRGRPMIARATASR